MCIVTTSGAEPGKTGTPSIDLIDDPEAQVANCDNRTCLKLTHERINTISMSFLWKLLMALELPSRPNYGEWENVSQH